MRIFTNLFLILFLADGTISMADELLTFCLNVELLTWLQNMVAILVVLVSFPLYFCIGIDKRLPKRILLPPICFVFWSLLALWPLPAFFERSILGLIASGIQVLLGMAAMLHIRKLNGKSLLMLKDMFMPHVFSIRYTALFFTGNIIILPMILAFFAFSGANFYLNKQTAGFVRVGLDGIYMTEKTYRLDEKTILLTSMIHIGEKDFYDELITSIGTGKTIVLAEGITDRNNLLKNSLSYNKIAEVLGLVSQEKIKFNGRQGNIDDVAMSDPSEDHDSAPLIVRADIDTSRFNPQTIEFLNVIGKHLLNSSSFNEGLPLYNEWVNEHMSEEMIQVIMDDILYSRNREVIRYMEKALGRYNNIVIPWGALHMPEIEEAVLDQGFLLEGVKERLSIDFRRIFFTYI